MLTKWYWFCKLGVMIPSLWQHESSLLEITEALRSISSSVGDLGIQADPSCSQLATIATLASTNATPSSSAVSPVQYLQAHSTTTGNLSFHTEPGTPVSEAPVVLFTLLLSWRLWLRGDRGTKTPMHCSFQKAIIYVLWEWSENRFNYESSIQESGHQELRVRLRENISPPDPSTTLLQSLKQLNSFFKGEGEKKRKSLQTVWLMHPTGLNSVFRLSPYLGNMN